MARMKRMSQSVEVRTAKHWKVFGWAVGGGERPIKLGDSWFSPKYFLE